MRCPFCYAAETKVNDSRLDADGSKVRRRRQCLQCNERFTTFEIAELIMPVVLKRDGRREPFNINNLKAGLLRALEKRPVSMDTVEKVLEILKQQIRSLGEREVDSQQVGALVMKQLFNLDEVAYIRFASVYKRFKDVSDFKQTIDEMNDDRS